MVETCPSLEDIAAFLDGRLAGEERRRLITHLAGCPTCFEVWHNAADFERHQRQEELATETAAEGAGDGEPGGARQAPPPLRPGEAPSTDLPAAALPPPLPFRPPSLPWRGAARGRPARWAAYAAAAVLAFATLGVAVYRSLTWKPPLSAGLVAQLTSGREAKPAGALVSWLYEERRLRGGSGMPPPSAWRHASFMVGVELLDLRLALEAHNAKKADELMRGINKNAQSLPFPGPGKAFFEKMASGGELTEGDLSSELLARTAAAEHDLEGSSDHAYLAFGRWAETAHIAAGAHEREFFLSRETKHHLQWLLDQKEEDALDAGDVATLLALRNRIDRGQLSAADLDQIQRDLPRLIKSHEAAAESPES